MLGVLALLLCSSVLAASSSRMGSSPRASERAAQVEWRVSLPDGEIVPVVPCTSSAPTSRFRGVLEVSLPDGEMVPVYERTVTACRTGSASGSSVVRTVDSAQCGYTPRLSALRGVSHLRTVQVPSASVYTTSNDQLLSEVRNFASTVPFLMDTWLTSWSLEHVSVPLRQQVYRREDLTHRKIRAYLPYELLKTGEALQQRLQVAKCDTPSVVVDSVAIQLHKATSIILEHLCSVFPNFMSPTLGTRLQRSGSGNSALAYGTFTPRTTTAMRYVMPVHQGLRLY
ncbi:MAG: hypothetical protein MHM6MM_000064 [Cercozoa sp. M6MM]